jgi:hypothetical protein
MQSAQTTPLNKRNFVLGVANGAIYQVALACMDPGTVIAAFVVHLLAGDPRLMYWIALMNCIRSAGWLWPPPLMAGLMERTPRKLGFYRFSSATRIAAMAAVAFAVVPRATEGSMGTFIAFAVLMSLVTSFGGIGMIPFFDIVSKSMPANHLGRFFGMRQFFGGILAFAAGFAVKHILDERTGYPFPTSYAAVFQLACVAAAVSALCFSVVDEPPGVAHRRRLSLVLQMRRGPRIMRRDRNYRNLIFVRVLSGLTNLALPFIVPFAQLRLGATEAMVGLFVSILTLSATASNILWSRVSDAQGNRRLLLLTNSLALGAPFLALFARRLSAHVAVTWLGVGFTPQLVVVSLVLLLLGFAQTGRMMGETNFMLEIAPARQRPTYMGTMHAVMFPLAFAPLIGAAVIGAQQRFELGFGISILFGIGCLAATLWLKEPRAQRAEGN